MKIQKFTGLKFRKRIGLGAALAMIAVGGVAFALLQTRGSVSGNMISTANADLLVSTDGVNYSHAVSGFSFSNLMPGGYPAPANGYAVYVKNAGNTDLDLSLGLDNAPTNTGSADLTKLNVNLTDASGLTIPGNFVLGTMVSGDQPVSGDLHPGAVRQYKLQAAAADGATPGATVSNINLSFIGTPRDPNDPNQKSSAL